MDLNLAAEQFPGAIEIVDFYHAKQHFCDDVAKAIYGPWDRLGRPMGQRPPVHLTKPGGLTLRQRRC